MNFDFFKHKFTFPSLAIVMLGCALAFTAEAHSTMEDVQKTTISALAIDTMPSQSMQSFKIMRSDGDKQLEMTMENGEVTDLSVNGKKIDKKDYGQYQDLIDENKPKSHNGGTMFLFGDGADGFGQVEMRMMVDSMMKGFNRDFTFDNFQFGDGFKALRENMRQFGFFNDSTFHFNFNLDSLDAFGYDRGRHPFEFKGDIDRDRTYDGESDSSVLVDKENTITDVIGNNLNKDGLLIPGQENQIELSGKYLKINGEKQPTNIWQKYKRLFEESAGSALDKSARLKFSYLGKESKRKFRVY